MSAAWRTLWFLGYDARSTGNKRKKTDKLATKTSKYLRQKTAPGEFKHGLKGAEHLEGHVHGQGRQRGAADGPAHGAGAAHRPGCRCDEDADGPEPRARPRSTDQARERPRHPAGRRAPGGPRARAGGRGEGPGPRGGGGAALGHRLGGSRTRGTARWSPGSDAAQSSARVLPGA